MATSFAILGLIITILGWIISDAFIRRRESHTREIERKLERTDKEIEQFYGPLFNLVRIIVNQFYILNEILKRGNNLSDQQKKDIEDYFREHIFWPLHSEAINILKTHMYLVHDKDELKPFYDYLTHVTQQRIQHELFTSKGVQTDYLKGIEWTQELWGELEKGLRRAFEEQKELIEKRYAKTLKRKIA